MVIISRMSKHWVATGYGGKNDERLGLHKLPKNHKKRVTYSILLRQSIFNEINGVTLSITANIGGYSADFH